MTIRRLSPDVAQLIAAGEVVERPLSAVKELIENSLDAGAETVKVSLTAGGKSLIAVSDDGCGIAEEELSLAVEKHATSKIVTVDDLEAVTSLGYRGEALPSLAAVAELDLRSRVKGRSGARLTVRKGEVRLSSCECQVGTTVTVSDLFYNLPARRKFLKSSQGELRRIAELVRDYAICWPRVAFRLEHEGRVIFASSGNGERADILALRWGKEPAARKREGCDACGRCELWWQDGGVGSRFALIAFINGRRVNDKSLRAAITGHPWAGRGNWFLSLTLPPEDLDVNIHPAKTEVLLRRSGEVFSLVRAVAGLFATDHASLPPKGFTVSAAEYRVAGGDSPFRALSSPFERQSPPSFAGRLSDRQSGRSGSSVGGSLPFDTSVFARQAPLGSASGAVKDLVDLPLLRQGTGDPLYLGQLPEGYLAFCDGDGLVLMDPHAAHERINYRALIRQWEEGQPLCQPLAAPLDLPPTLGEELAGREGDLEPLGFRFEGSRLVAVPQVPFDITPLRLLRGALAALEEGKNRDLLDRFASRACKASIKLTARVSEAEARALWHRLEDLEKSCPHGRPVTLRLSAKALDDYFGRNGL